MLVHVSPCAPRTSSAARQHIVAAWRRGSPHLHAAATTRARRELHLGEVLGRQGRVLYPTNPVDELSSAHPELAGGLLVCESRVDPLVLLVVGGVDRLERGDVREHAASGP